MQNNITRREWLVGTTAVAGGLMLSSRASAQTMMNMGKPISKDNPIRYTNNENPYGINPKVMDIMLEAHKKAHLYNFTVRRDLVKVIADIENVPVECIAPAAGSTEFLMAAGVLCGMAGGNVVAPNPTYGTITRYVENFGGEVIEVPVGDDMAINLDAMRKAVTPNTKIVYLCNPNNPIPTIIEKNALREFCLEMSKKALVVVDEAYYEFARDDNYATMTGLAKDNPNILVIRTASKIHAFANVRIGFAFAHPDTIKTISRFGSNTMSYPAIKGAIASYQDKEFQKFIVDKNYESLNIIYKMFEELDLPYIKSNANFTYFDAGRSANEVRDKLLESGILVGREFTPFTNWVRVSMAKPEEMEYLVKVYKRDFA